ncbi:MAG: 4Fe-4S ferredoxin [Clostridia bacterium]|nr:4Fe-4S ferredoxin [Clostridia bacterium]
MTKKSHMNWSWIFMILFLTLSIYDFKFGILGFICMGTPIVHALKGDGKIHCQKYCPRGSLLGKFLEEISMKNNHPKFITTNQFKNFMLILMMSVFSFSMYHTGGQLNKIAFAMFRFMTVSMILGIIMGIIYKPRTWCIICPMGHASGLIKQNQDNRAKKAIQLETPKRAA